MRGGRSGVADSFVEPSPSLLTSTAIGVAASIEERSKDGVASAHAGRVAT